MLRYLFLVFERMGRKDMTVNLNGPEENYINDWEIKGQSINHEDQDCYCLFLITWDLIVIDLCSLTKKKKSKTGIFIKSCTKNQADHSLSELPGSTTASYFLAFWDIAYI